MGYTCPNCGRYLCDYNEAQPRICPHCHCDTITGAAPGEKGYLGNWTIENNNTNNNQPSHSNTPPMTREEFRAHFTAGLGAAAILCFVFASLFVAAYFVQVIGYSFDHHPSKTIIDAFPDALEDATPLLLLLGAAFYVVSIILWQVYKKREHLSDAENKAELKSNLWIVWGLISLSLLALAIWGFSLGLFGYGNLRPGLIIMGVVSTVLLVLTIRKTFKERRKYN